MLGLFLNTLSQVFLCQNQYFILKFLFVTCKWSEGNDPGFLIEKFSIQIRKS